MQYLEVISSLILRLNLTFGFQTSKFGVGSIVRPASFWIIGGPPQTETGYCLLAGACRRKPAVCVAIFLLEKVVLRVSAYM